MTRRRAMDASRRDNRCRNHHVGVLRPILSACSIGTSASVASAMGVARMPTFWSWRPCVLSVTGRPALSMLTRSRRVLLVGDRDRDGDRLPGRNAASTPRPLLLANLPSTISSECSVPFCVTERKPAPFRPSLRWPHHGVRDVGVRAGRQSSSPQPWANQSLRRRSFAPAAIAALARSSCISGSASLGESSRRTGSVHARRATRTEFQHRQSARNSRAPSPRSVAPATSSPPRQPPR